MTQAKQETSTVRELMDEVARLKAELAATKSVIESDRTKIIDGVNVLSDAIKRRHWLMHSRGSYAWDDEKFHDEFRSAIDEIDKAVTPLGAIGGDRSNCPLTTDEIIKSRMEKDAEIATLTARIEALHLMQELGEDLAWRSYLGIQVLQAVLNKSKLEAGADVSAKLLADIAAQYPHFPAKSALRPMPTRRELENKPSDEPIAGEHQEVFDAIEACNTGEE